MSTVVLEPMRDWVLVRLRPVADKTGLIHRVVHFEASRWADVLAVGPEVRDVAVGMVVLVNPLIGQIIQDDLLVPEPSIMAYE